MLAQNANFYCSPTSGLLELLYAARNNFTNLTEFKLQPKEAMKSAWDGFCRGAVEGYYSGLTEKKVAVDKSRGWIAYYDWLKQFYGNPKIIVCVRDIRGILASMEKLHRRNAHLHEPAENPTQMQFQTVEQRVAHWLTNPPVGLALTRLKDAIHVGNAEHFHFVRFEDLTLKPQEAMDAVYDFLEEERFSHDFSAVKSQVVENDAEHGKYGDHVTREQVQPVAEDWDKVLGKELSAALVIRHKWFYDRFYN